MVKMWIVTRAFNEVFYTKYYAKESLLWGGGGVALRTSVNYVSTVLIKHKQRVPCSRSWSSQ